MTNIPPSISSGNAETCNCDINDSDFFENLLLLFDDIKFSDITLTDARGGTKVRAHRLILSARSRYFSTMFDSSFKEAQAKEVKLQDIDGKTLQKVISFLYSNKIDLEGDTVENVLKAAVLLQIWQLEELADQYHIGALCDYAYKFALHHFMEVCHNEEFFLLDRHQLSNFISSDEIRVSSEEDIFNSMLAWVQHDLEGRKQFLEELFQHLRLTLLSPTFIARTVEPAIQSRKCKKLVSIAYQWHLLPELRQSLVPERQIQRGIVNDVFIAIDGWENNECYLRVALYSPASKEWSYRECPKPLEKREKFGVATLNEKLYIAGGLLANGQDSNSVDCLDLKTFQWTRLPPMLTARYFCGMTALNGQLYVVGGLSDPGFSYEPLRSVEKWDPLTGAWEYITPMTIAVQCPIVGVIGSLLCVARVNYNGKKNLDIYDPLTKEWTNGWSQMPCDLLGIATVSINRVDHFLIISKNQIQVYNDLENKNTIIPVDGAHYFFPNKFAVFNDSIIIKNGSGFRQYCFVENNWKSMPGADKSISRDQVLVPQGM